MKPFTKSKIRFIQPIKKAKAALKETKIALTIITQILKKYIKYSRKVKRCVKTLTITVGFSKALVILFATEIEKNASTYALLQGYMVKLMLLWR